MREGGVADGGYLSAGFLNVNSLKAHIQKIRQFLRDDPYNLFGIAERKLGPVVQDYLVRIDDYTLVPQGRMLGGCGVPLRVRNTLKLKILEKSNTTKTSNNNQPEYLICSVQWVDSSLIFVTMVYRSLHLGLYTNGLDEHLRSCGPNDHHHFRYTH